MPLHIFEGLSGKLITTILRSGLWNKQANISKLLQKLISYLLVQWPETKITVTSLTDFRTSDLYEKGYCALGSIIQLKIIETAAWVKEIKLR